MQPSASRASWQQNLAGTMHNFDRGRWCCNVPPGCTWSCRARSAANRPLCHGLRCGRRGRHSLSADRDCGRAIAVTSSGRQHGTSRPSAAAWHLRLGYSVRSAQGPSPLHCTSSSYFGGPRRPCSAHPFRPLPCCHLLIRRHSRGCSALHSDLCQGFVSSSSGRRGPSASCQVHPAPATAG